MKHLKTLALTGMIALASCSKQEQPITVAIEDIGGVYALRADNTTQYLEAHYSEWSQDKHFRASLQITYLRPGEEKKIGKERPNEKIACMGASNYAFGSTLNDPATIDRGVYRVNAGTAENPVCGKTRVWWTSKNPPECKDQWYEGTMLTPQEEEKMQKLYTEAIEAMHRAHTKK